MQRSPLLLLIMALCACGKEHMPGPSNAVASLPVVNEIVSHGSAQRNEFGVASDWVEIHNPGPAMELHAGSWYVTDDPDHEPLKFELPEMEITEGGYLVIWCDGLDGVAEGVHTNFSLSANDHRFALVQLSEYGTRVIDVVPVPTRNTEGLSYGRAPDGTVQWGQLSYPTPGVRNAPLIDA